MELNAGCDDVCKLTVDQARAGCLPKFLGEKENGRAHFIQLVPLTTISYI